MTYLVTFGPRSEPASLAGAAGPSGLGLDLRIAYRIHSSGDADRSSLWRVATTAYEYRLLDHDQSELLVYHWQPDPAMAGPTFPHLHVSAALEAKVTALQTRSIPLDKKHLPTERVALAAVVRMLIEEFGIAPIAADWQRLLARAGVDA